MTVRGILLKGVAIPVVTLPGILFALHKDRSVATDVLINRRPADVWKVVSDSTGYRDWNPFITNVAGNFVEGSSIRIVIGTGSGSIVFTPTVLLVRPKRDLCWRGSVWIRGIFDGEHCIHLSDVATPAF
ncbi:SRPBCC family protein [Trinickia sp. NRRL B-1857]|uniref:SRPBCC family protein n=1 Tax=Trinickia sp. NRRL B-1857 TaxID=3162879 RepID=UPI003D29ABA8